MSGDETESIIDLEDDYDDDKSDTGSETSDHNTHASEYGGGSRSRGEDGGHKVHRYPGLVPGVASRLTVKPYYLATERDKAELYFALLASNTVEYPVPPSFRSARVTEGKSHGELDDDELEELQQRYPEWSVANRRFVVRCLRAANLHVPDKLLQSIPRDYVVYQYFHTGACFDKKQEFDMYMDNCAREFEEWTGHTLSTLERVMWETVQEMTLPTTAAPAKKRSSKGSPTVEPVDDGRQIYNPGTVGLFSNVSIRPEPAQFVVLKELGRSLVASAIVVHPIRPASVSNETARLMVERRRKLGQDLPNWSKNTAKLIAECVSAAGQQVPQVLTYHATKSQSTLYRFIGPGFPTKEMYDAFYRKMSINYKKETGQNFKQTAEAALWGIYRKTHKSFQDIMNARKEKRKLELIAAKQLQEDEQILKKVAKSSSRRTAAGTASAKRGREPASMGKPRARAAARRSRTASADGASNGFGNREGKPPNKRSHSLPLYHSRTEGTKVPLPRAKHRVTQTESSAAIASGPASRGARNEEGEQRGGGNTQRLLEERNDEGTNSKIESDFNSLLSRLNAEAHAAKERVQQAATQKKTR